MKCIPARGRALVIYAGSGRRQVQEIVALGRRVEENGIIETSTVFQRTDGELAVNASARPAEEKFARSGYNVAQLLESGA